MNEMKEELPPGPELDLFIAEKVMGLQQKDFKPRGMDSFSARSIPPPPYSTDIATAWEVVEKITGSSLWCGITVTQRPRQANAGKAWDKNGYKILVESGYGGQGAYPGPEVNADTVAHGICLVAIKLYKQVKKSLGEEPNW